MNAVGLPTCRRSGSYRRCLILTLIAMLAVSTRSPIVPTVHAQLPVGAGFTLDAGDLRFIFQQILISQDHAAASRTNPNASPFDVNLPNRVPEPRLPFGLRTVDGSFNHVTPNHTGFGAADRLFPRRTRGFVRSLGQTPPAYRPGASVVDPQPRIISNLIVDQTMTNPAAIVAAEKTGGGLIDENGNGILDPEETQFFIPNIAPDVGLSAPFNIMFVFFGQFFDHGLDLLAKSPTVTVTVPLQSDDPLFVQGGPNAMFINRGVGGVSAGPDGVLNTADDVPEGRNKTTPFVDQNQTYTSHPSHQVFLREYVSTAAGPVPNGKVLDGVGGNIANWGEVKLQARTLLGIDLIDADVLDVPRVQVDPYGHFIPGPGGFPRLMLSNGALVGGTAAAPVPTCVNLTQRTTDPRCVARGGVPALTTGHQFLDDIAHEAVPNGVRDVDYDGALLDAHFCTGDGRGNENIALTAVHTIFHSEHNRLALEIGGANGVSGGLIDTLLTVDEAAAWRAPHAGSGWGYGERVFQAARFVTEMQYQHLVFEEFARKVQPGINEFIGDGINFQSDTNPAIVAEFAHTVYRFGHSMLTETISRTLEDGTVVDIPLLTAFLNPRAFNNITLADGTTRLLDSRQAAGAIFQGGARQVANEIDEFKTEALRNRLLGLPLDLAAINLARGRSEAIAPLNEVRRQLYEATGDSILTPYLSWKDFELSMRHPESVVNFIAAYGVHPSLTAAGNNVGLRRAAAFTLYGTGLTPFMFDQSGTTGVENIDLWIGGLAEKQSPFGGLLGSTFNAVFELQLENLQNADRFYYLERLDGLNLLAQLEGNSFAELIARNTTAGSSFGADIFSRPDLVFNLANLGTEGAIPDDLSTPDDESLMTDLIRLPDGTFRYFGPAHVIWNGRDANLQPDRVISSEGDDTLRGANGDDRMEGGAGNDQFLGGEGDDILVDSFGEDVIKGGPGNDVISGGAGPFDLLQGNQGSDYIVGGTDVTETFGGPGDDVIYTGDGPTEAFGDTGNDWMEGGPQLDLLVGDSNNQFQDDPTGGHDVIIGGKGDDDYDSEGGDDIMVADVLGTERLEGMLGFDFVTYRGDPLPVNADMNIRVVLPPNLDEVRDRFDLVEALSGWDRDDILAGDDRVEADFDGHRLTVQGSERVAGLQALIGAATFSGGNILMGGAGSDRIEGRGGNDFIDGDAWLNVQLEVGTTGRLANSLLAFKAEMIAGTLRPQQLEIRRSIVPGVAGTDIDTAVFRDVQANYTITPNGDGTITVAHVNPVGAIDDGIDTVRNVERLQFTDVNIAADPGLTLVLAFPIGNERVFAGVPTTIRWRSSNANSIRVELSLNNGGAFTQIFNLAGNPQQVVWTPTNQQAANNARIRVTAVQGANTASDVSGAGFQITTEAPDLAVTVPAVGASLIVSATQNLRWTHNLTNNARMRVELLRGNPPAQTVQLLSASYTNTANQASVFPWIVAGPAAVARVRVTWVDAPSVTATSGVFSIALPTVTVTAPNVLETWAVGSTRTIRWNHNIPGSGRVNIDISRAGGAVNSFTPLATNIANATATSGSFSWVVSSPASTTARIQVRWVTNAAVTDISDVNFVIAAPTMAVTQPNGNVRIGTEPNVRVTSNLGPNEVFGIELTRDGGLSWEPLPNGTTNNNGVVVMPWLVEGPATTGTTARIRATWLKDPTVVAQSVAFAILNPL